MPLAYISHSSKDKNDAQIARSVIASHKDMRAACSSDYGPAGDLIRDPKDKAQPTDLLDRRSALDGADYFIMLRPLTDDAPTHVIFMELAIYLDLHARGAKPPKVYFFHHGDTRGW
jgi:hypothetical protein